MEELAASPAAKPCQTNQVLYNLTRRGIEYDLMPWSRERGMPIMAYSPVEQGELTNDRRLAGIADRHGATPAQIALAWVLRQPGVIAIPKAATPAPCAREPGGARRAADARPTLPNSIACFRRQAGSCRSK